MGLSVLHGAVLHRNRQILTSNGLLVLHGAADATRLATGMPPPQVAEKVGAILDDLFKTTGPPSGRICAPVYSLVFF